MITEHSTSNQIIHAVSTPSISHYLFLVFLFISEPHPPHTLSFSFFHCPLLLCLPLCVIYLHFSHFYSSITDLQDWRAVQSSQIFPWSVYHPTRRLGRVSHRSALHILTSAPTWSTTYARYTAAPPSPWSQRPEDWALQKVRFTPHTGIVAPPWTITSIYLQIGAVSTNRKNKQDVGDYSRRGEAKQRQPSRPHPTVVIWTYIKEPQNTHKKHVVKWSIYYFMHSLKEGISVLLFSACVPVSDFLDY